MPLQQNAGTAGWITFARGDEACDAAVAADRRTAEALDSGKSQAEQLCLGCHSKAGGASVPAVFSHPQTSLKDVKNATTQPTALIDQFGNINQITCYTCHLSHGRDVPGSVTDQAAMKSFKAMLRPNVDREVCAACHGIESIRRFLYFHSSEKRLEFRRPVSSP